LCIAADVDGLLKAEGAEGAEEQEGWDWFLDEHDILLC